MDEFNEAILIEEKKEKKCYKNKKLIICTSFLCSSLAIGCLLFINIKCGSFSNAISPCDYPNFCPNKQQICDGSDLI